MFSGIHTEVAGVGIHRVEDGYSLWILEFFWEFSEAQLNNEYYKLCILKLFLPRKIPLRSPRPIPGNKVPRAAIIAGAAAVPTVPATTGAMAPPAPPAAAPPEAAPPAAAPPAAAPPAAVPPPPTAVACNTETRGPMRLVRDWMKGSGEGTGEPRERRNTDWVRRNTWRMKEIVKE